MKRSSMGDTSVPPPAQYTRSQRSASLSPADHSPSEQVPPSEQSKRKSRQKPKIELAPDQPTTTQGKQRKRVYVACLQCRTRKIRCDGAKPVCHNCGHRQNSNGKCDYDAVPRRRGPDKTPGARQRMGRDTKDITDPSSSRRRRRRHDSPLPTPVTPRTDESPDRHSLYHVQPQNVPYPNPNSIISNGSLSPTSSSDYVQSPVSYAPVPVAVQSFDASENPANVHAHSFHRVDLSPPQYYNPPTTLACQYKQFYGVKPVICTSLASHACITPLDEDDNPEDSTEIEISTAPSLNFTKKIWYESLCSLYASPHSRHLRTLNHSERDQISQRIASDLRFLFRSSNYWFSFFHLPSFFGTFFDPVKRANMQPSLILAALALSTFWQSSEVGRSNEGRLKALRLRDEAQAAIEASFNAGWVDETLAQAAWLLALFEVCAHPKHSTTRSVSAMRMLDSTIRSLALTFMDRDNPQASVFNPDDVPVVARRPTPNFLSNSADYGYHHRHSYPPSSDSLNGPSGCSCQSVTLANHWPSSLEHAPLWAQTPAWNPDWSEAEIKKESCRRLCWSASSLAAGHVSYAVASRTNRPELFIADPANYALLFSGESVTSGSPTPTVLTSKDSVWALYDRCFLLWNSCAKMRFSRTATDNEKAQFAIRSWLEADAIENALNKHTCGIEKAFIFQGREYLFNTRMCITYEFQRYVPMVNSEVSGFFHRKKAEEWLSHQAAVAQRFMYGLHTITGNSNNLLARRPFFTLWFMAQVNRALSLWQCDHSMVLALDVCKAFLPAIDYLSALWPCDEQRKRYERLRVELDSACRQAGVSLPLSPNLSLNLTADMLV
uniref:Zn(2)-C6 fungal-type domain-containing protein n=2 Tax=Moniliophthora roreri TaxID=221103 RepID=A0A0W0FU75_MONRR